jgi:hypothetical protein
MDQALAKAGDKTYSLSPEGQWQFVCVDGISLGLHANPSFGNKLEEKYALIFQIDETNPDTGKRFELAQRFTLTMGKKANLRKFLGQWRGRSYTEDEAKAGAPLAALEGANGFVVIEHKLSKDGEKTYASILSVSPLPQGTKKIVPVGYSRNEYWATVQAKAVAPKEAEDPDSFPSALADQDDDLPF